MGNVIYISGPMRGLIDYGRQNFRQAEEFLRKRFGYTVLNPAVLPLDLNPESYMPICLAMLREADHIGLLPGWQDSAGANLELRFAQETDKHVIDIAEEYGFSYEQEPEGTADFAGAMDAPEGWREETQDADGQSEVSG